MANHSITFHNNSNIPVSLETWQQESYGLSKYNYQYVNIGEIVKMRSETGEWFITTYLCDNELCKTIISSGYNTGITIAKFWDKPYLNGKYVSINVDSFDFEFVFVQENLVCKMIN